MSTGIPPKPTTPSLVKRSSDTFAGPRSGINNDISYGTMDDAGSLSSRLTETQVSPPVRTSDLHARVEPPSFRQLIPYYLPIFTWLPKYDRSKCLYDFVAGISLASFQIPLALSYATSLARVHPLCGLYSLAIPPFIYAIFGCVPQMIVGPESAISLVIGQTVEALRHSNDPNRPKAFDLSSVMAFITGLILLGAGMLRIGFLGSILSRALLRGFISSVGVVMIINSLITELRLDDLLLKSGTHYHTAFGKLIFILREGPKHYHGYTTMLSFVSLAVLLIFKYFKTRMMRTHKYAVLFPDVLIVVIITITLSATMNLSENYGVPTVREIDATAPTKLINPVSSKNISLFSGLADVSVILAILGFFESATAAKSLGGIDNATVSSNRELVALGVMNLAASLFGAIPAFGGYGRSKINALSGGVTSMTGVFIGTLTLFTIRYLLSFIHYIPTCILSVVTTYVGIALIEEVPEDIRFHLRCHGYSELAVFALTFVTTIFYSVEGGITVGCIFSTIAIIKHSAKSRIQILAKIEGTEHFADVDMYVKYVSESDTYDVLNLKEFEGCLVVKIPEPLTFSNSEDLKERLDRLERYGSTATHPGTRTLRSRDSIENVIFDLHGMTHMDSSAAQILKEIISRYNERGVHVFLTRVPLNESVRERLTSSAIVNMVELSPREERSTSIHSLYMGTSSQGSGSPFFINIQEALFAIEAAHNVSEPVSLRGSSGGLP